ncbi:hypothetical protein [Nitratiruptor sp. SB155-2]|uniref:hypothetical protein n=1 Tax=Nitratiruptor sp. (strain SB155-2) TaxID=387092 RepID=UPI00059C859E|nr:hypothetical protein [Nitratiruptor sp. SB155-2]
MNSQDIHEFLNHMIQHPSEFNPKYKSPITKERLKGWLLKIEPKPKRLDVENFIQNGIDIVNKTIDTAEVKFILMSCYDSHFRFDYDKILVKKSDKK